MPDVINRGLSDTFIEKLACEATKDGWWKDVLADSRLLVAVRKGYFNVYWRGQSLFRVESAESGFRTKTHGKYLLAPGLASYGALTARSFNISPLIKKGFIRHYEGPVTIDKMKRAA